MKKSVIRLKVNSGYQIVRKTKEVDLSTAFEILSSKQQKKYTEAVVYDDYAELVWHMVRCPYCGKETSLYEKENRGARRKFLSEEIAVKTGEQYSLLEKAEEHIVFHEEKQPAEIHICKKCRHSSEYSEDVSIITIIHDEKSINVFNVIRNMEDLLKVKWIDKISFDTIFPLCEKITFDFEKGKTFLFVTDKNEKVFSSKEVTQNIIDNRKSPIIDLISKSRRLKRSIKKEFTKRSEAYDFFYNECSFDRLLVFTRFGGFSKSFYEAAPYELTSYRIDGTFEESASQFNSLESAMQMLKESSLPDVKSVKRIFLDKQGLFFYIKECEKIYDVLNDVNLLCRVLTNENVYHILGKLHYCDGYICFYKDLCVREGKVNFCRFLLSHTFNLNQCAEKYCAKGKYMRERYMSELNVKEIVYGHYIVSGIKFFSVELPRMPEYIKDCSIGQFSFRNLITVDDFYIAGEKLNINVGWFDASVAVVIYQGEIVAAINVFERKILFVMTDKRMKENTPLYSAVKKWSEKYNLKFNYFE
ncbi:MAG: hypothetical protein E7555_10630 [Ruminococcaceae bacterium]|nr:hypothetical protein [Oscillospiraceae bacterium]